MTITEKNLAESLAGIYGDINDYDWATVARTAAELLGVKLAPEPKPLPAEPGFVIIATEVYGKTGKWRMMLDRDGEWFSPEPISGYQWHEPDHITVWTEATVVPVGEHVDPNDVREGDRVWMELEDGDEAVFTVTGAGMYGLLSRSNVYNLNTIRSVYLLHREEA